MQSSFMSVFEIFHFQWMPKIAIWLSGKYNVPQETVNTHPESFIFLVQSH